MRKETMKCPHGRTAHAVMAHDVVLRFVSRCSLCDPPRVTPTGRAISSGTVTRASLSVKRANNGKPLPMHLQCHPKALTRTPRNPQCYTYDAFAGLAVKLQSEMGFLGIMNGKGLKRKGKYQLAGERIHGYTDDAVYAKAWRSAAQFHGVRVEILE